MAALTWNVPAASDQVIGSNNADDMLAAINTVFVANSGGGSASWEVVSYVSTSPRSVLLRRKSLAAGRIVIFGQQGSTPNAAACAGTASASVLYIGYSATSTSNTVDASYLSAAPLSASDYMPGVRCCAQSTATWRVNYAEFADGVVILFSNTSNGIGAFGAGELIKDMSGTAVSTIFGNGSSGNTAWATSVSSSGSLIDAAVGASSYTSTNAGLFVRISGANKQAMRCQSMSTASAITKLDNSGTTLMYSLPIYIVHSTTDNTLNFVGKMRQIRFGPFCDRETTRTGGGITAYGHQSTSAGATNHGLWFVNTAAE